MRLTAIPIVTVSNGALQLYFFVTRPSPQVIPTSESEWYHPNPRYPHPWTHRNASASLFWVSLVYLCADYVMTTINNDFLSAPSRIPAKRLTSSTLASLSAIKAWGLQPTFYYTVYSDMLKRSSFSPTGGIADPEGCTIHRELAYLLSI
jgi:hypothetical protein